MKTKNKKSFKLSEKNLIGEKKKITNSREEENQFESYNRSYII